MNKTFFLSAIAITCLLLSVNNAVSQISHGGVPSSFYYPMPKSFSAPLVFSAPDIAEIAQEDNENSLHDKPYRIGKSVLANLNMNNSGIWDTLGDGSRVWRLTVKIPNALGIGVFYDRFYIPEGARLFIYNKSKSHVIGAYTNENNNYETGKFATEKVQGDEITLEYSEPLDSEDKGEISISKFGYFYRNCEYLNAFKPHEKENPQQIMGESTSCEVNVNCAEGDNWRDQQRSVVKIELSDKAGDMYICSGFMINNTNQDCTPYLLTASHCDQDVNTTSDGFANWIFFFNYESPTCANPKAQPQGYSISGAKFRSRSGDNLIGPNNGDFLLLELSQRPPLEWNVYYAGWDIAASQAGPGVGIHHPAGDIKKISTVRAINEGVFSDQSTVNTHWRIGWAKTSNGTGVTEGGSSGSPLFNADGRAIGELSGGNSSCYNYDSRISAYGRISYNWTSNGTTADKHLKEWLDPNNNNTQQLDGKNNDSTRSSVKVFLTSDKTSGKAPLTVKFKSDFSGYPEPTVVWKFNDSTVNSTLPNPTHTFTKDGVYNVWLIASNGYTSDSTVVTVTVATINTAIYDDNLDGLVIMFPNPTDGNVNIKFGNIVQDKAIMTVVNSIGSIVYAREIKSFSNSEVSIDLSELVSGIYYLNVQIADRVVRKKISIIH